MKAKRVSTTNVTLTLPGAGDDRNLPATRFLAYDPELGETQADAKPAWETIWTADEGERRALANGADLRLTIIGEHHPPVSIGVGEPTDLNALVAKAHVDRAVGYWFAAMGKLLAEGKPWPDDAAVVLEMWHEALEATMNADDPPPPLAEELAAIDAKLDEAE